MALLQSATGLFRKGRSEIQQVLTEEQIKLYRIQVRMYPLGFVTKLINSARLFELGRVAYKLVLYDEGGAYFAYLF